MFRSYCRGSNKASPILTLLYNSISMQYGAILRCTLPFFLQTVSIPQNYVPEVVPETDLT